MRLLNADHITLAFLFEGGGKASREFIDLKRVGHKPSLREKLPVLPFGGSDPTRGVSLHILRLYLE